MKIPWTELRLLATLKRIARALERASELESHRQAVEYPRLPEPRSGDDRKKIEISKPTVDDWNKRHAGA